MPVTDSAAPTQWRRPSRSRPSSAEAIATTTGVAPMISAAFETLVMATPPTKQIWYRKWPMRPRTARSSQSRRVTSCVVWTTDDSCPGAPRARRFAHAIAPANTSAAMTRRSALNGCGGISRNARLMTLKFAPQMSTISTSSASMRLMEQTTV
jgi:hypothetical protein